MRIAGPIVSVADREARFVGGAAMDVGDRVVLYVGGPGACIVDSKPCEVYSSVWQGCSSLEPVNSPAFTRGWPGMLVFCLSLVSSFGHVVYG